MQIKKRQILLLMILTLVVSSCYLSPPNNLPTERSNRVLMNYNLSSDRRVPMEVEDSFEEVAKTENISTSSRVVVMLPFSGKFGKLSQFIVEGANYALDEAYPNNTSPYSMIQEDTAGSPQIGAEIISEYRKLTLQPLLLVLWHLMLQLL